MRLLGLDPGLRRTGWGIIEAEDNRLGFVAAGAITTDAGHDLASRLDHLFVSLSAMIAEHAPDEAAVEETFVNKNAQSALKLGQARGVVLLAPARAGLQVSEYSANLIKKTVVGAGHAAKEQVQMMVKTLLPTSNVGRDADAADALAVAICHAHHRETHARIAAMERAAMGGGR